LLQYKTATEPHHCQWLANSTHVLHVTYNGLNGKQIKLIWCNNA